MRIGTTVADDTVGLQVNQIDPAKDPEAKATFPAYTAWTVHITGSVYGGGNAAPLTGSTDVWMRKGLVEKNIFGGGLGSRAAVTGSATVKVTGSSEVQRNVYGGGYGGIVFGNTDVTVGE